MKRAAALAFLLTIGYALLVAPRWEPTLSDQLSYLGLARGLVERGEYTRAPVGDAFAAEPLRPPGYPLFLAPLCVGSCDHWRIAVSQALLYAALVLLAYTLAARLLSRRAATVAAVLVAAYLPIAYFASLALSDFLAVFLLVAGAAAFVRARERSSIGWGIAAGALLGWLALTRAVYVLLPGALALVVLVVEGRRVLRRGVILPMAAATVAFAITLAPLLIYSNTYFGRPFASSSGSAVWLGAVQGLSESTADDFERAEVAVVRQEVSAFDAVSDRVAQADAWIRLNVQLEEHGQRVIAHDPLGYLARTPVRAFVLWASDVPLPVDAANALPSSIAAAIDGVELALLFFGIVGAIALARRRSDAALLPLAVIVYVSVLSIPLGTEARYALAAKPFVLLAAVASLSVLRRAPARAART